MKRNLVHDKNVIFKPIYETKKLEFYCNNKDPTPMMNQSFVVYKFNCPGCGHSYVGKTERSLFIRCKERATTKTAINKHLRQCGQLTDYLNLMTMGLSLSRNEVQSNYLNAVVNNTRVIDRCDNWSVLLFKEALHIKDKNPILNHGLKASKDLIVFR